MAAAGVLFLAIAIWRLAHPATVLVPGQPTALRIVYYAPGPATPANPDATHPTKAVSISDQSRVRSIARELNGLAAVQSGVASTCVIDYGTHDALTFAYIGGGTRTVNLQTSGCMIASEDGAVSRWPRGTDANFAVYRELRWLQCPAESQVHWLVPCSGP